jgi:RNA recognition motif-containing protein
MKIIAKRNIRMRGQAFIIFKDINSAMEARRNFNGRELYGKTMVRVISTREYNLPKKSQMLLPNLMVPSKSDKNQKITINLNSKRSLYIVPSKSEHASNAKKTSSKN